MGAGRQLHRAYPGVLVGRFAGRPTGHDRAPDRVGAHLGETMVANAEPQRTDSYDALVQRIAALERALDESSRASRFPFVISHGGGVSDFQIIPSTSGDGSADILIGDGAGGKLMQITTDAVYGTKILRFLDQAGNTMMSTDAAAGFGWGTPSYPFVYEGRTWNQTLAGATSQATAVEIGRGLNYVYNPATFINPIVRITSITAETVKVFAQWKDAQENINNTADATLIVTAGGVNVDANSCNFGKLW